MPDVYQQQTFTATGKVYCGQIAFLADVPENSGMAKRRKSHPKTAGRTAARRSKVRAAGVEPRKASKHGIPPRLNYLAGWIEVLEIERSEILASVQIGKSYLSQICNNKGKEPSTLVMLAISESLGVTVNDLYRPAPADKHTAIGLVKLWTVNQEAFQRLHPGYRL